MLAIFTDYPNLLAVITMIGWGTSNGFMKVPTIRIGSAKAIRLRQGIMLCLLISYKYFFDNHPLGDHYWMLWSVALGFVGYLPFLFFCEGLRIGSIGVVNAIANSFPVISAVLTSIFFGTQISFGSGVGIALTTLGVLILSLTQKKSHLKHEKGNHSVKAIIYALLACILWGGFYTVIMIPNSHLDPITLTLSLQLGTFFSSHLHSMMQNKKRNIPRHSLIFSFYAGVTAVVGSLCFYNALHLGNPGIATAIAGSSPIVGAVFGNVVYKEKSSKQEILGILVAVCGVVALSVLK